MFNKRSKLQLVLLRLESTARRLTESRNHAPAIGGRYGTYGTYGGTFITGGWTR